MELPLQFVLNMKELLGEDFGAYEKSFADDRLLGLRVNPLKVSAVDFLAKAPFSLEKVPWCNEGFYYSEALRPAKHPYYHAGLYYLQEPSAMSPGAVLAINPNDKVLDLCAAPGGKTTQLGAKLNNTGVLVANDISAGRTKAVLKNIELFGIKNCIVMSESPSKLEKPFANYFDKILVDAPCSGEGMFRKEKDVIKSWNEEMLAFCQTEQKKILESAAKMLKMGGLMLYSTCTFSPLENEKSIADFLHTHDDFELVPISESYGFSNGITTVGEVYMAELAYTKRLWPHKIKGEGHFLALLHKKGEPDQSIYSEEVEKTDSRMEIYFSFMKEVFNFEPDGVYQIINDSLYLLPRGVPNLKGIRVLRSGWLLGEFKKNRFEPSQALAMGITADQGKNCVNLSLDDHRVIRYLKGETVEDENCKDGWCVVCVDGYPLGFAKAQRGRLKNKYAIGWKWE